MTNAHDWVDKSSSPRPEYGSVDTLVGWVIYSVAVLFLIV